MIKFWLSLLRLREGQFNDYCSTDNQYKTHNSRPRLERNAPCNFIFSSTFLSVESFWDRSALADPLLESGLFVPADLSRTSLGQHSERILLFIVRGELKNFLKQTVDSCLVKIG